MEKETAVICTTFNKAEQVYRNLWCLAHQDYPLDKFVVIVIDDASVDHTQTKIMEAYEEFPQLNMINILTDRKAKGHFGGQGLVYNIGLRYAEELGVEYIINTGGDILLPSYAIRTHLELHKDARKRAWAVASQFNTLGELTELFQDGPPDPASDHEKLVKTVPDVLVGPRQYFVRPDRESLGNNVPLLGSIPDRYDWKPAEKLLSQPEALTLEEFPNNTHIYIGLTGDKPCDTHHPHWPTLQSCKLEHWLNIGGWDEGGTGTFWEDESLRLRLIKYAHYRNEQGITNLMSIVHPSTECYHTPHPRQLSHDNHATFLDHDKKYGFNVNEEMEIDWGRSKHEIIFSRGV